MVRTKGSIILCGAFLFVAWNALLLLYLWGRPPIGRLGEGGGAEPGGKEEWGMGMERAGQVNLAEEMIRLAEEVEVQLDTQKKLLKQIESHRSAWAQQESVGKREMDSVKEVVVRPQLLKTPDFLLNDLNIGPDTESKRSQRAEWTAAPSSHPKDSQEKLQNAELTSPAPSPEPIIPILVIACDRVTVKRSLDKLIQYRPSAELYPIIVSQDCGHAETARVIGSYGDQVMHIRQPDLSDIRVRPEHRKFQGYYKIARHYRWALSQVFTTLSQSTVVVVEDDLEVSAVKEPCRSSSNQYLTCQRCLLEQPQFGETV